MPRKIPFPVIYVSKKDLARKGLKPCFLNKFPNAGPDPNITGMRIRFWGNEAPLIKHGSYVYKVPVHVYKLFSS